MDVLDIPMILSEDSRKRSRLDLDGTKTSKVIDHGRLNAGDGPNVKTPWVKRVYDTSYSDVLHRDVGNNNDGTTPEETREVVPADASPLPDYRQSGDPIKTKMELTGLF
ncbi:unnamed protein product [Laminaria digitata]